MLPTSLTTYEALLYLNRSKRWLQNRIKTVNPSQERQNIISLPEWKSLEEIFQVPIFVVLVLNKGSNMFL